MTEANSSKSRRTVPFSLYDALEYATPEERTELVLRYIEEHGQPLELPERDGARAHLSEVDFSRDGLRKLLADSGSHAASWWNDRFQGAALGWANLQGADLVKANLQGATLTRANLQGANLVRANLQSVDLSSANLQHTDLTSANLQGASLGYANLQHADLTSANLQGAFLGRANLQGAFLGRANLQRATLQEANLQGADLSRVKLQSAYLNTANLRNAKLIDAFLPGTNLTSVNLQRATLRGANLQGAHLRGADLRGANLSSAQLQGADLRTARLEEVDLLDTENIESIYLSRARLDGTRLRREQLGGKLGDELEAEKPGADPSKRATSYRDAKSAYLALKQNFEGLGDYDAASWAYRKERQMEKSEVRYTARAARKEHRWRDAAKAYLAWVNDTLQWVICDYGENPWLVLLWIGIVFLAFTVGYGLTNSVLQGDLATGHVSHNPGDWALFSLGAMTTMGAEGLSPACTAAQVAARMEALLTVALTGLLGFVIGNRIRHS